MFEYLKMYMGKDGIERCHSYKDFKLETDGAWLGTMYSLENNHIKNCWQINLINQYGYVRGIVKGKGETLDLRQFINWLKSKNNKDEYMDFLKSNKWFCEKYPNAAGVKWLKQNKG
ncbi:MAG: hypothetical protein RR052_03510 [Oscillospiraceae bacterium]